MSLRGLLISYNGERIIEVEERQGSDGLRYHPLKIVAKDGFCDTIKTFIFDNYDKKHDTLNYFEQDLYETQQSV